MSYVVNNQYDTGEPRYFDDRDDARAFLYTEGLRIRKTYATDKWPESKFGENSSIFLSVISGGTDDMMDSDQDWPPEWLDELSKEQLATAQALSDTIGAEEKKRNDEWKAKPKPLCKRKLAVMVGEDGERAAKRHEGVFSSEEDCQTAADLISKLNGIAAKFEMSFEEL
jgi:hypothetical protein